MIDEEEFVSECINLVVDEEQKEIVSESFDLNEDVHDNIFEVIESIENFYGENYCHKEYYGSHDLLVENSVNYYYSRKYGDSNSEWVNMDEFFDQANWLSNYMQSTSMSYSYR